jgi:adenosylmethionine-8-amino-7-oxononanoate aminotransferase
MKQADLIRRDRDHVWHPCTQEKDHELLPPIPIAHGEGVWLTAVDGKRYLDGVSSWWVNLFGHNHPRLNRALLEQAGKISHLIFAGFTHEPAIELAERLCAAAPGKLSKVFFADNGSSAIEAALKMSFQFWQQSGQVGKNRFLSISEAYHGETLGALSVGGCELYRDIYRPILLDTFQAQGPDCFRCPFGLARESCQAECFGSLETVAEQHHEKIAAIVIEPLIQAAAGMRIYPPLYLKKLRALCDRLGIHYIADEIAVGFGRTGKMFANEHAGVAPDLLCLSKGITGGYLPLSAVLTTEEIYRAFYDDYTTLKAFLHSHSYTGNALACAVAVEVQKIFAEEEILARLPAKMAQFDAAAARFTALEHIGEFRRCGMVAAVELVQEQQGKIGYAWQERRGYQVYRKALERGALLRPLGNVVYFMPPLSIETEELDLLLEIAYDAIRDVTTS